PAGWDYASQCAKWDRTPPPPLDLGRYVRLINIRRSAAQSEAAPSAPEHHGTGAPLPPARAPMRGTGAPPATGQVPPTPGAAPPHGAPEPGRRKRRAPPKPTSLISYVPPQARQPSSEIGRKPLAPSPPPDQPARPRGNQSEFAWPKDDPHLNAD